MSGADELGALRQEPLFACYLDELNEVRSSCISRSDSRQLLRLGSEGASAVLIKRHLAQSDSIPALSLACLAILAKSLRRVACNVPVWCIRRHTFWNGSGTPGPIQQFQ